MAWEAQDNDWLLVQPPQASVQLNVQAAVVPPNAAAAVVPPNTAVELPAVELPAVDAVAATTETLTDAAAAAFDIDDDAANRVPEPAPADPVQGRQPRPCMLES